MNLPPMHRACGDGSRHFDVLHLLSYYSHVESIVCGSLTAVSADVIYQ